MTKSVKKAVALLSTIESQLKLMELWESTSPPVEALASTEPFCLDTLQFSQWLQFVFITRLNALMQAGQLPRLNSQVAAMAEECFKGADPLAGELINTLAELDCHLSRS